MRGKGADKKERGIPSDRHFAALYNSLTMAGLRPPIWRLAKYRAASKINSERIRKYLRERFSRGYRIQP